MTAAGCNCSSGSASQGRAGSGRGGELLATFAETATGMLALALVVAPGVLLAAWFFPDEEG